MEGLKIQNHQNNIIIIIKSLSQHQKSSKNHEKSGAHIRIIRPMPNWLSHVIPPIARRTCGCRLAGPWPWDTAAHRAAVKTAAARTAAGCDGCDGCFLPKPEKNVEKCGKMWKNVEKCGKQTVANGIWEYFGDLWEEMPNTFGETVGIGW